MKYGTICKAFDFDAAHRLDRLPPTHKCHRLHGHTYRVEITLHGAIDDQIGFIVDYQEIADAWQPVHDQLDHRYLNDIPGLEVPSTEVLAHWILARLKPALPLLLKVRVYESATTWCEVFPPAGA